MWAPPSYLSGCSQAVWSVGTRPFSRGTTTTRPSGSRARSSTRAGFVPVIGSGDCAWGLLDGLNDAGLAVSLAFGGRKVVGGGLRRPSRRPLSPRDVRDDRAGARDAPPAAVPPRAHAHDRRPRGDVCTAYISPDRDVVLTTGRAATNHQGSVEWHEHAQRHEERRARSATLERLVDRRVERRAVRRRLPPAAALCRRRRPPPGHALHRRLPRRRRHAPSSAGRDCRWDQRLRRVHRGHARGRARARAPRRDRPRETVLTSRPSRSHSGRRPRVSPTMIRLHDFAASANCFKVRMLLSQLGLPYERVPVDIFAGDCADRRLPRPQPGRAHAAARDRGRLGDPRVRRDPALPRRGHAAPAGRPRRARPRPRLDVLRAEPARAQRRHRPLLAPDRS